MKHLCKHSRKKCIFLSEVSVVEVTPWMSICRTHNSNTRNLFWLFPIQSSAGVDVDEGTRPVPTTVKLSRCLSWIRRNLSSLVGQISSVPPVNGSSLLIGSCNFLALVAWTAGSQERLMYNGQGSLEELFALIKNNTQTFTFTVSQKGKKLVSTI